MVLPRSALNAKGSADFRRDNLQRNENMTLLCCLTKEAGYLTMLSTAYTMALVSVGPPVRSFEQQIPLRGPFSSLERFIAGCRISRHSCE